MRSFYARKVESLQNKYLAQVAAIRRGNGAEEGEERDAQRPLAATERASFLSRIALLENELLRTAEEVGKAKAVSVAAAPSAVPPAAAGGGTDVVIEDTNAKERQQLTLEVNSLHQQVKELSGLLQAAHNREELPSTVTSNVHRVDGSSSTGDSTALLREKEELEDNVAQLRQRLLETEREQTRLNAVARETQLRHEFDLSKKDNEIRSLQAELRHVGEQLKKPESPEMRNFMVNPLTNE